MARYLRTWFWVDLFVILMPWLLVASDAFARAGGGGSESCKGWVCIVLYPVFLAYGAYVSVRLTMKYKRIRAALAEISRRHPQWSEQHLLQFVTSEFMSLQTAWSDQNLDVMRQHLHPVLYANWEIQIRDQQARGEKNLMKGVSINKVRIVDVQDYRDEERDEFTAAIDARAIDETWIRDTLKKSESKAFREFWTFEWEGDSWKLRNITQSDGWKRFVNARIIRE